jgi:hypothetical protein
MTELTRMYDALPVRVDCSAIVPVMWWNTTHPMCAPTDPVGIPGVDESTDAERHLMYACATTVLLVIVMIWIVEPCLRYTPTFSVPWLRAWPLFPYLMHSAPASDSVNLDKDKEDDDDDDDDDDMYFSPHPHIRLVDGEDFSESKQHVRSPSEDSDDGQPIDFFMSHHELLQPL